MNTPTRPYLSWITGNPEVDRNEGSLDYFRIADNPEVIAWQLESK